MTNLATTHPNITKEWVRPTSGTHTPHNVTPSSTLTAIWKCSTCGWEREATITSRTKNNPTDTPTCAVCTNRIIIPGINDVATTHPHYLTWWHPNNTTTPQQATASSHKKILFQCPTYPEHTFTRTLLNFRAKCPQCTPRGQLMTTTTHAQPQTLTHTHPHIAAQWDYTSPTNTGKTPDTITYGSRFKAAWKCDQGHGWTATINSRTNKNAGCPTCANKTVTPGINDLATTHPDILTWWHPNNTQHPTTLTKGSSQKITFTCPNQGHTFTRPLRRFNYTCPHCVATKNGTTYTPHKKQITLQEHSPHIAAQWDYTSPTNTGKTPDTITYGSQFKAAWKCDNGHGWEARILSRTTKNSQCPTCAPRSKAIPGITDLATTHPDILTWWHPNNTHTPTTLTKGSNKKTLFQCPTQHHTFTQRIVNFTFTCPTCHHEANNLHSHTLTEQPHLIDEWHPDNPPMDTFTYNSAKRVKWRCAQPGCSHVWETTVYQRVNNTTICPACSGRMQGSQAEETIAQHFINTHGFTEGTSLIRQARPIPDSNLEADIYFPDHKLAVEHNGLYWHNEKHKPDRNAHKHKYETFKNAGIQLIQIWEDDYLRAPDLVHAMIAHKLGISHQPTIGARKLTTTPITYTQATTFLNSNHIQGGMRGTLYLALTDHANTIRAVSVWRKNHNQLYLERYATNARIPGGLGKLLKHVTTHITPTLNIERIITFADHLVSDGTLYETLGFTRDKKLKVDYQYVTGKKRVHKFNYRIKRFKQDPTLQYQEGLTETQLAQLNNLPRIWDAGKTRYTLNIKDPT